MCGALPSLAQSRCPTSTSVLVCLGCHTKIPYWGLKQQTFIFSQFWSLKVQDQGVGRLVSPEARLLGLQTVVFSLSPHMAFSLHVHPWYLPLFLKGHQSYWIRALSEGLHFNITTSLKTLSPNDLHSEALVGRTLAYDFEDTVQPVTTLQSRGDAPQGEVTPSTWPS